MSPTLARSPSDGQIARRGLTAVEFVCPRCSGTRWGETYGRGHCNTADCGFSWDRELDWLYFHRKADGRGFLSGEAFELVIGPEPPRLTYVGNLNDLLEGT